jgi:hypothetical protein
MLIHEMHRSIVVSLGNFLYLQWLFFLPWLLSSPLLIGTQIAITLLWLLCLVLPGLHAHDEGRLGGSITGWPWKAGLAS